MYRFLPPALQQIFFVTIDPCPGWPPLTVTQFSLGPAGELHKTFVSGRYTSRVKYKNTEYRMYP